MQIFLNQTLAKNKIFIISTEYCLVGLISYFLSSLFFDLTFFGVFLGDFLDDSGDFLCFGFGHFKTLFKVNLTRQAMDDLVLIEN